MQIQKSGKKLYVNCRGKYVAKCEGSKTIHLEEVHELVEAEIQKKLGELSSTKIETSNINARAINEININITKIDEQIAQLLDKIIEATPTVIDYINKKIEELDQDKQELVKQLQDKKIDNSYEDLEEVFDVDFSSLDFDTKRKVSRILISRIELSDEVCRIRFNI